MTLRDELPNEPAQTALEPRTGDESKGNPKRAAKRAGTARSAKRRFLSAAAAGGALGALAVATGLDIVVDAIYFIAKRRRRGGAA